MRAFGFIIKIPLSIAAMVYIIRTDSLGAGLVAFPAVYGLLTYAFFALSLTVGGVAVEFSIFGLLATLCMLVLTVILTLGVACVVLLIPQFILQHFFPGETAELIYGIGFIIAGAACVAIDVRRIINAFKPASFEQVAEVRDPEKDIPATAGERRRQLPILKGNRDSQKEG